MGLPQRQWVHMYTTVVWVNYNELTAMSLELW